jgi:hypothetical protein
MIALAVALTGGVTFGAEYFLAPDGDDANEGSREAPWRSIDRANEALEPGDTAVFLPGEYAGTIRPATSGTAGAPITYRSAEHRAARLIPVQSAEIIRLDGHEHITIEGFFIDGENRANWGLLSNSGHITISGCEMRRNPRTMNVLACSQVRLLDNVFSADRPRGDMLHLTDSTEILFEGNSTAHSGHCPLRVHRCNNVTVRANVFRNEWGRNYEFWKSARMLVERNIITRARDSAGSGGASAKNLFDYGIYRQNLIFDNLGHSWNSSGYIWTGSAPDSPLYRGPFRAVNSRYYNNTVADNLGLGWAFGGINTSANVYQNNIFHRNDWTGGHVHIDRREGITGDNRFNSNLFWSGAPGQALVRHAREYWTIDEANRNTPTIGDFWSEYFANVEGDPAFVDAENRDFRLRPESAAIDAGTALTWAVGSGTGPVLPVNDGVFFYDGFGIEGEEGDIIAIGSGDNTARIERVELRHYLPALLHLDREVTWENAMPVSLPWAGEAPDIGAWEHGLSHSPRMSAVARPATPQPGQAVSFVLDAPGREIESVSWHFDDATFATEVAPTHAFAEPGNYGVTVRATFADGGRDVAAAFVRVQRPADPGAPLVEADFEDETRLTHWDYQFKFYRPHQTGSAHVERPDGEGKCMHVFYDANKSNQTAGQIAPGLWEIDRYPIVRFEYRIPRGVPVTVSVAPFEAPGRAGNFFLAATENQAARTGRLDGYTLIDDGQWHTLTMDVRRVREIEPDLQHLRQWTFTTPWGTVPPPTGWLNFSALQADFRSRPAGPEDVAVLGNLDIVMLRGRAPGQWLEMPFTLAEETTGEVFVNLLDHTSRGAVRILLNGEVVIEDYEHWADGIVPGRVSLGQMTLPAGEHTLRLEVLERRVGFIGLTGVSIRPEGAAEAADLTLEDFEFWFDNFAILPE